MPKQDLFKITFAPHQSLGFHFVDDTDPKVTIEYVPDKGDLDRLCAKLDGGSLSWRCEVKTTCKDQQNYDNPKKNWRRVFVYLRKEVKTFDGVSGSKKKPSIVVQPSVTLEPDFQQLVVVDFRKGNTTDGDYHNWSLRTQEEMIENGKTVIRTVIWSFSVHQCSWKPNTNRVLFCEIVNEERLAGTNLIGRKLKLIGPGYVVKKSRLPHRMEQPTSITTVAA